MQPDPEQREALGCTWALVDRPFTSTVQPPSGHSGRAATPQTACPPPTPTARAVLTRHPHPAHPAPLHLSGGAAAPSPPAHRHCRSPPPTSRAVLPRQPPPRSFCTVARSSPSRPLLPPPSPPRSFGVVADTPSGARLVPFSLPPHALGVRGRPRTPSARRVPPAARPSLGRCPRHAGDPVLVCPPCRCSRALLSA